MGFWYYPVAGNDGIPVVLYKPDFSELFYVEVIGASSTTFNVSSPAGSGGVSLSGGGVPEVGWNYLCTSVNAAGTLLTGATITFESGYGWFEAVNIAISPALGAMAMDSISISGIATVSGFIDEGKIAEVFVTNSDIFAGVGVDEGFVRQLAYRGPFSCPHVAPSVVVYESLRQGYNNSDQLGESYTMFGKPITWTAANTPQVGIHPPLEPGYVRPNQTIQNLMI